MKELMTNSFLYAPDKNGNGGGSGAPEETAAIESTPTLDLHEEEYDAYKIGVPGSKAAAKPKMKNS